MKYSHRYIIGIVMMIFAFCLTGQVGAEVQASFRQRYLFERIKGISWYDATEKTQRKWLLAQKKRDKKAREVQQWVQGRENFQKAYEEHKRSLEKERVAMREHYRNHKAYTAKYKLERKREQLKLNVGDMKTKLKRRNRGEY